MTTKTDEVNDAMVDTYRALRELNRKASEAPVATRSIVPGAGVDPKRVVKPSKRLRNWHRQSGAKVSLKAYASLILLGDGNAIAAAWHANKKAVR
jgi:hypothetical protein